MKIYNKIGSKERFLEMFQGVNKLKLNEAFEQFSTMNALESEFNALANGDIRVERSNTKVNGNVTNIDLETVDNQGNKITFLFEIQSEAGDQAGVSNIGNISLIKFIFQGKDGASNIQIDKNNLNDFNTKYSDAFYNIIQEYIDTQSEQPAIDETFIDAVKKVDSYPFGGGRDNIQTGKSYVDTKPTNPDLRVNAPELNKYVDENIGELKPIDLSAKSPIEDLPADKKAIILKAINNLTYKKGRPEYAPNVHEINDEIKRIQSLGGAIEEIDYQDDIKNIVNQEISRFKQQTQLPVINEPEVDDSTDNISSENREFIIKAYDNLIKKGIPAPTTNQVQAEILRMQNIGGNVQKQRAYPNWADNFMEEDINFADNSATDELLGFKPMNVGDNIEEEYNEIFNPEGDAFLRKIKLENPDNYVLFRNLIRNKGLQYANDRYNQMYPQQIVSVIDNKTKIEKFVSRLGKDFLFNVKNSESIGSNDVALYTTIGKYLQKFRDPFDFDLLNDEEQDYLIELIIQKFPELEF